MELTDEMWKELGFTKQLSNGGEERWYHNQYLGRDFIFFDYGFSVNQGFLTISCKNKIESLKQLSTAIYSALTQANRLIGKQELRQKFNNLLNPD